ncbi:hypothetical protein SAMN04488511_11441 [Pedobacter suwonensis]|uniref:Uncharacterized protein n=1 Tax=Pedobacter suwonensis TaxID=332999 RepID=A0A1I0TSW1_9SPHI|nr:hypothetical protein [Pedobacter suwonensis]SFA54911.1 hypothetical protein SAMN04488511_11441 [Pedobacter suwonensis]
MKILKENYILVDGSVNLSYFETHSTITGSYDTRSSWRRALENTSILAYTISYWAGNEKKDKYFVSYNRTLEMQCDFEDLEKDVDQIIEIKKKMHLSLSEFLKENCQSFYSSLKFVPQTFGEYDITREKSSINRAMVEKAFEDLSNEEK